MSEALEGAKLRYSELDKMAYAVVMASQKLKHYFTIHPITIPTSYPLRDVFENREAIERISNWVAELVPFTLSFITRSTIKLQGWQSSSSIGHRPRQSAVPRCSSPSRQLSSTGPTVLPEPGPQPSYPPRQGKRSDTLSASITSAPTIP